MYAVIVGRERKVVETWDECKALVKGYPKNLYKKVNTEEEGQALIDSYTSDTVEKTGFEEKRFHVYSSLTKSRKTPNIIISVRCTQDVKGFGHFKEQTSRVVCTIKSPIELNYPVAKDVLSWDKLPRYIYEVDLKGLYADKFTSILTVLKQLFSELRLKHSDISILLNTDSNLLLHSLSKNIFRNLEVMSISNVQYKELLLEMYNLLSTFDGLVLNYESGDRVSLESHYTNLYLKGEFNIYDERT